MTTILISVNELTPGRDVLRNNADWLRKFVMHQMSSACALSFKIFADDHAHVFMTQTCFFLKQKQKHSLRRKTCLRAQNRLNIYVHLNLPIPGGYDRARHAEKKNGAARQITPGNEVAKKTVFKPCWLVNIEGRLHR